VVLADGGFQANRTLVRSHLGRHADQALLRGAGAAQGDALRLGLGVGAQAVGLENVYGHLMHRDALTDDRFWPAPILDPLLRPGILVDRWGARVLDEERGGIAATNELMRSADPRGAWIVVGEAGWNSVGVESTLGLPTPAPNPTLTDRGATMVYAGDLTALARAAGMTSDALAVSVAAGRDRRAHTAMLEPPFIAIPVVPGITFTMGGLAIDGRARVLRADGSPITGLLAVGSCTGGLHGGPDAGYVGGLSAALVLGYVAAGSG
jgi:fumarate reductase flavoprotein subunit